MAGFNIGGRGVAGESGPVTVGPLPKVTRKLPEPPPPPPPPSRLSNGAPRFVDSAVPLPLELEAVA